MTCNIPTTLPSAATRAPGFASSPAPAFPQPGRGLVLGVFLACATLGAQAQAPVGRSITAEELAYAVKQTRQADPVGPKVDPVLAALALRNGPDAALRAQGATSEVPWRTNVVGRNDCVPGKLVPVNAQALLQQLAAMGAREIEDHQSVISACLPFEALKKLQTLPAQSVRFAPPPLTQAGSVTSQGDSAQRSDFARQFFGVDGTGTTVGILSDSFNALGGWKAGVRSGNLPGPGNPNGYTTAVRILGDAPPDFGGRDEGRAMAEIVHDVAPGARILFHSPATFHSHASAITRLANEGATVVVDDVFYLDEPWYQRSPIAVAAADAARKGTVVVASAGNRGRFSLESRFAPGPLKNLFGLDGTSVGTYRLHQFAPGRSTVRLDIPGGARFAIALQWDDPFKTVPKTGGSGSRADLDLLLFTDRGAGIVAGGSLYPSVGDDPTEYVDLSLDLPPDQVLTLYVGVGAAGNAPLPANFKIVVAQGNEVIDADKAFDRATIVGHANAASILSVCAADTTKVTSGGEGAVVRSYSSVGGFRRTLDYQGNRLPVPFQVAKPDVCSPSQVNNSFFGTDTDGDGWPNFDGTSSAAPHLAGVISLLQQLNPKLTPAEVMQLIRTHAVDMDNPETIGFDRGHDVKSGWGFALASKLLLAAKTASAGQVKVAAPIDEE